MKKDIKINIDEKECLDEALGHWISIASVTMMLGMNGVIAADKLQHGLENAAKTSAQPLSIKSKEVEKAFNDAVVLKQKFGKWTAPQAVSILAKTLFGEARGSKERKANGHKLVLDVILNRCNGKLEHVADVCLEHAKNGVCQFSYWNGRTLPTASSYDPKTVPAECKSSQIDVKAWNEMLDLAAAVFTGKYTQSNTTINSYYVYTGPGKVTPDWSSQMTSTTTAGSHKFGYVKTNAWEYRATNPNRKADTKPKSIVYVVKPGDVLGKIAKAHKVKIDDIVSINPGLDPDKIKAGQKLKLPA